MLAVQSGIAKYHFLYSYSGPGAFSNARRAFFPDSPGIFNEVLQMATKGHTCFYLFEFVSFLIFDFVLLSSQTSYQCFLNFWPSQYLVSYKQVLLKKRAAVLETTLIIHALKYKKPINKLLVLNGQDFT